MDHLAYPVLEAVALPVAESQICRLVLCGLLLHQRHVEPTQNYFDIESAKAAASMTREQIKDLIHSYKEFHMKMTIWIHKRMIYAIIVYWNTERVCFLITCQISSQTLMIVEGMTTRLYYQRQDGRNLHWWPYNSHSTLALVEPTQLHRPSQSYVYSRINDLKSENFHSVDIKICTSPSFLVR